MGRRSRFTTPLLAAAAAVVLGATLPVLGFVAPAQAHNYPISSTPKAGETLTALPAKFEIVTNDVLLDIDGTGAGFALQVTDAAGRYYGDGCVTVAGPSMSTAAALGAAGRYTVTWQAVSTDGHTTSDSFTFSWQPPADFTPSTGSATAPDCHGTSSVNSTATASGGSTGQTSTGRTVDGGTLGAVLWIGGAILAVAAGVILTLLLLGRKKGTS
jgi:methionine-rich copper-binding protein CopC